MRAYLSLLKKTWVELKEPPRSPLWPRIRREHLQTEGWCRYCGGTENLEVHHIVPFHLDRSLELTPSNLITLCEKRGTECHLHIGHHGNWHIFNPMVRRQADSPKRHQAAKDYIPGSWP
jgi:5-methylcytosine-specific restriction endonuclease McrA